MSTSVGVCWVIPTDKRLGRTPDCHAARLVEALAYGGTLYRAVIAGYIDHGTIFIDL